MHVFEEPTYYLSRCDGSSHEATEAADFHSQGRDADRDIVLKGLRKAGADAALIALVESGADVSWPGCAGYTDIVNTLKETD